MNTTQAQTRPRWRRWLNLDTANRALTLLLLAFVGYHAVNYQNYVECVAAYQDRQAASNAARAAAADLDRGAEDDMWQAFADAGDPTKVPPAQAREYARAAFEKFLRIRSDARQQRAKNPLPEGPSEACK